MKKTIDQWLNEELDTYSRIGIPIYEANRHLVIQLCEGDRVAQSGERDMFEITAVYPTADDLLTQEEFEEIRDGVVELVVT